MSWTVLNFGKHKGNTLPQIMFTDPHWFYLAFEDGTFNDRGNLLKEANDIFQKSTTIKILQKGEETLVAEYRIHPASQNSVGFELVEQSRLPDQGATTVLRRFVIDLSIPEKIEGYDKLEYKTFLMNLKHYLFGSEKIKITKERCEEFFNNNSNFLLP
jgi:hypothetical protein